MTPASAITHCEYMRQAIVLARQAAQSGETPVGAALVCGGRVIARAHNLVETLNDPTAHAEMQVISAAGRRLGQCALYVTLEPCPMCAAAMFWAQLGLLVYGAPDPKRGYTLVPAPLLHPKTQVISGIAAQECGALMSDFFKKRRSVK